MTRSKKHRFCFSGSEDKAHAPEEAFGDPPARFAVAPAKETFRITGADEKPITHLLPLSSDGVSRPAARTTAGSVTMLGRRRGPHRDTPADLRDLEERLRAFLEEDR